MKELTASVLVDGFELPVDPRWHGGRFWVSDLKSGRVTSIDLSGRTTVLFRLEDDWPGGLGFLPDGSLLCVSFWKKLVLRWKETRPPSIFKDLHDIPGQAINDMTVDGAGRAYIATRAVAGVWPRTETPEDAIVLLEPTGAMRVVTENMHHPDGMAITPDGRTFISAECAGHRLTAFDIGSDGSLMNRRLFADLGRATPDGICLDADGALWVASPFTAEVFRVRQGGEITHRIPIGGGKRPTSCALGGPDRKTLFIATSVMANPRSAARDTGNGFGEVAVVDVPGVGWP